MALQMPVTDMTPWGCAAKMIFFSFSIAATSALEVSSTFVVVAQPWSLSTQKTTMRLVQKKQEGVVSVQRCMDGDFGKDSHGHAMENNHSNRTPFDPTCT